jgi:hypothetical protein
VKQLNIGIRSAYSWVYNIQSHKVCARNSWMSICFCHLAHYCKEEDNFLQWIVTGDGTSETKQKSITCCTQPLTDRLMLTFLTPQGTVLKTYLEGDCHKLQRGLKVAICSKMKGSLSEDVLLHKTMPIPILHSVQWKPSGI